MAVISLVIDAIGKTAPEFFERRVSPLAASCTSTLEERRKTWSGWAA